MALSIAYTIQPVALMHMQKVNERRRIREVVLKKVTKTYHGFDFEQEEIRDNLLTYENQYFENIDPDEQYNPEELERMAREEYLRDKAEREAFAKSKKG